MRVVREQPSDGLAEAHPVFINISPLASLHMLFPWFIHERRPQVLTHDSIERAAAVAAQYGDLFKLVFNSLGAWASQNHLHWHGFVCTQGLLPIEMAPRQLI